MRQLASELIRPQVIPQLISALAGSCGFAVEAHDPDKKSMVAEAIPTVPGGKKSA